LLVQGHNEEEKDGFLGAKIASPWEFRYKRMVWDLIYERIGKNEGGGLPTECTAIYEFISPTYRPIFSPVLEKSGFAMKTLGEDLGNLMNEEIMRNPQIKAMLDNDMPFNLYVVSHSQGGLVARAGLRFMDERLLKNLKKVITWGTPHYGASLMSLRYALTVGHDIIIDGNRFPLQNIGQSNAYQSFVAGMALDAPGIRDMRWDWSKRELLRLGDLMRENTATLNEFVETELPYGRLFFSDNLKTFNETEGQNVSGLLQDKYMFYYATTPKNASLERGWFFLWRLWRFQSGSTPIEQGAQLNKLTMQDPHKDSDGAASIYSQRADGLYPGGGILRRWFNDIDHEEFYGSEPPHRDDASLVQGRMIARETLTDLGMYGVRSRCATIRLNENTENDTLYLTGQLDYFIYQSAHGGDDKPGKRILKIEGRFEEPTGDVLEVLNFTFKDDGSFEGKAPSGLIPSLDTLYVTVILKDSSEVYFPLPSPGEALVNNVTKNKWYKTISKATERWECSDGDLILVYPGVFKEHVSIGSRNITVRSVKGPEETIIEGKDYTGGSYAGVTLSNKVVFEGFTVQNWEWGIEAYDGVIRIANNIVIGTPDKPGPGVYVWKGSPVIENNLVHDCTGTGIGIQNTFNPEGYPKIIGNTIYNNRVGIFVGEGNVDIIGNNIYNNSTQQFDTSPGVNTSYNVGNAIIRENRIHGNTGFNKGGMNINGNALIESNVLENNQSVSGSGGGISIHGDNKTRTIVNNIIRGNLAGYSGGGINIQVANGITEVVNNQIIQNSAADGGGLSGRPSQISGNQFVSNTATRYGGAIFGRSLAWNSAETVTVQGLPRVVNRHVPCFSEGTNTYTGNTHGVMEGNWGPGIDNWCPNVGFNVWSN
jgi:predicted outer membrane repeat protein